MSQTGYGLLVTCIALFFGFVAIGMDIRDDWQHLKIWDERFQQYMGYRPMYRDLDFWDRLEIIMMPRLHFQIEQAFQNWKIDKGFTGHPFVDSEPILGGHQMAELTRLSRELLRQYQGSPFEYFSRRKTRHSAESAATTSWH